MAIAKNVVDFLRDIPDLSDYALVQDWLTRRLRALAGATFDDETRSTFAMVTPPETASFGSVLGPYGSPSWRRFALATLLADWACYATSADRADFARLLYVLSCFPAGFRVWTCILPDGQVTPVGYTGWYPISRNIFDVITTDPGSITHRGFMGPMRELKPEGDYIYLFNASIVPSLRGSELSGRLMRSYAATLARVKALGKASVAVSTDGIRASRVLGLAHVGDMMFEGEKEHVFAMRKDDQIVA